MKQFSGSVKAKSRRARALVRLEQQLAIAISSDRWTDAQRDRMKKEIATLKDRI